MKITAETDSNLGMSLRVILPGWGGRTAMCCPTGLLLSPIFLYANELIRIEMNKGSEIGKGGIQTNQFPDQGKFYLLSVKIDPLFRQKHIHVRGDHFSSVYPLFLLLSDELEQSFLDGEILAYWIFMVEETPDEFIRHGEHSQNLDRIDRDKINQWLASLSNPDSVQFSTTRAKEEKRIFSYLHLIPLSFN